MATLRKFATLFLVAMLLLAVVVAPLAASALGAGPTASQGASITGSASVSPLAQGTPRIMSDECPGCSGGGG